MIDLCVLLHCEITHVSKSTETGMEVVLNNTGLFVCRAMPSQSLESC